MHWIRSSVRLPEHTGPETFYGGKASRVVIGLWTQGKLPEVRQCLHIDYDSEGDQDRDPADGWMDVDESGNLDRCTSHGGQAPTFWMPMPEIPA